MTTIVTVDMGGTGATHAAGAREALSVPSVTDMGQSYAQANSARDQANTAYGQANNARSDANTTFATINTTFGTVNTSLGTINTNYQAAYTQANTARTTANDAYGAANTKLASSGGTLSGDLIITGNLTVSGNQTILNTEVLTTEDADIILLSNTSSTPALNAGLIINRGTSTNTFLRWDEALDEWGWSDSGTTTYYFEDLRSGLATTNTTFGTINTSLGTINTNYQAAYTQANTATTNAGNAYGQANNAYGAANNRVLKAGDTMTGNLNIAATLITQNVEPVANITYDLGTSTKRYKDLWLSNSTIYLGDTTISSQSGNVSIGNANLQLPNIILSGGIESANQLNIKTTVTAANLVLSTNNVVGVSMNVDQFNKQYIGFGNTNPRDMGDFVFGGDRQFGRWDLCEIAQQSGTEADFYQYHNIGYSVLYNSYGDIGLRAFLNGDGKSLNSNILYFKGYNDTANAYLQLFGNKVHIAGSGNVGIGTTSPGAKLEVSGQDSSGTIIVSGDGGTNGIRLNLKSTAANGKQWMLMSGGTSHGGAGVFNIRDGTDGYNRLTIDSSGNVGLGTTSPGYKLDVYQSTNDTTIRAITAGAGAWLVVHDTTSYYAGTRHVGANGSRYWLSGMSQGIQNYCISMSSDGATNRFLTIDTSGNVGIGTTGPTVKLFVASSESGYTANLAESVTKSAVLFKTHSSDSTVTSFGGISGGAAFIQRSNGGGTTAYGLCLNPFGGNVGIGTSSPARKLHVTTTGTDIATFNGANTGFVIQDNGSGLNQVELVGYRDDDSSYNDILIRGSAVGLFINGTTGNVGIGITTPNTVFNIYGGTAGNKTDLLAISHPAGASAQPVLRFDTIPANDNVLGRISVKDAGSYNGDMIFEVAATRGAASTTTTERMIIKNDGNVGIGTTSPTGKLHIYDTSNQSGDATLYIQSPSSNDWGIKVAKTGYDFGMVVEVDSSAGYGISIYAGSSYVFRATGGGNLLLTGTLTESSSIELKENIDPITNALDSITKLVGVTYDRKDGSAQNRAGLIAESVAKVLPNVVNGDGIQYTNLIAYLVESIKELKAEIDVLKSK